MIDLALDPSETRETRQPEARPQRSPNLRMILLGLAGAGALGAFGVAASTLMAGLAAPTPVKLTSPITTSSRAADWPELKDGLPAVAGAAQPAAAKPAEPATPALRMAALPGSFTPPVSPPANATQNAAAPSPPPVQAAAASDPPTRRIPTPTPVAPLAPARQVVPLPPSRTAALQPPRTSETVRARELAEPAAPKPVAVTTPAALAPHEKVEKAEKTEKPARKAVAAHKAPAQAKAAEKAKNPPSAAVAQTEASEPEETEVLGIKLPSLAPAGRKLKESVDALGDAVKKVF
jgi:hypothetical protein